MGIRPAPVVMDVHVPERGHKERRQAVVEVSVAGIEREPCVADKVKVGGCPQVEIVHVRHVLERELNRAFGCSTPEFLQGCPELPV